MDEAASRLRMQQESKPDNIAKLERSVLNLRVEIEALKREGDSASRARRKTQEAKLEVQAAEVAVLLEAWGLEKEKRRVFHDLKERLDSTRLEYDKALRNGDYMLASQLRHQVLPELERNLAAAQPPEGVEADVVGADDVAFVVSRHTGIPVARLLQGEREKLLRMEQVLAGRVVGQQAAIAAISNCVRVSRAGLHAHSKPTGVFFFLGPSGVGKTELAKALAQFLFDDENALFRLDMSEYMERHDVSRMIGTSPGYVGYEEGGQLTNAVRRRPYQIVLLDEIEKAHHDVSNVLLQVFDEGHLTDGQGHKVDFRNTIIILTSNLGVADAERAGVAGDAEAERRVMQDALRAHFPPEFLNRVDEVVAFRRLGREDMRPIAGIQLDRVRAMLAERSVTLDVAPSALDWIADQGYDSTYGARPLKRLVHTALLNPLSVKILQGGIKDGSRVEISHQPSFKVVPSPGRSKWAAASSSSLSQKTSDAAEDKLQINVFEPPLAGAAQNAADTEDSAAAAASEKKEDGTEGPALQ
jgi:ATP-dependent Clp protease ATP-binding subunit ClpB